MVLSNEHIFQMIDSVSNVVSEAKERHFTQKNYKQKSSETGISFGAFLFAQEHLFLRKIQYYISIFASYLHWLAQCKATLRNIA